MTVKEGQDPLSALRGASRSKSGKTPKEWLAKARGDKFPVKSQRDMGMQHKEKLLAVHNHQACIEESQVAFSCPDAQTNKEELQGADHGL